jgi:hypothetical protein
MKSFKITTLVVALIASSMSVNTYAFDLGKSLSAVTGGNSENSVDASTLVQKTRNTLGAFAKAQLGLADALGGYESFAEQQKLLEGMKMGDAAASKSDIETIVNTSKSAAEAIAQKTAENAPLDAKHKKLAMIASVEYVKALVSSKKLVGSVQGAVKNPTALGTNAPALFYVGKELPGIITGGASATTSLFKYLSANGVDISKAKAQAADLGV